MYSFTVGVGVFIYLHYTVSLAHFWVAGVMYMQEKTTGQSPNICLTETQLTTPSVIILQ